MESIFVSHGRWDNHFSFNTVFPFAYSNLVEVKDKICTRILDMGLEIWPFGCRLPSTISY
jgi:hypothetical protein